MKWRGLPWVKPPNSPGSPTRIRKDKPGILTTEDTETTETGLFGELKKAEKEKIRKIRGHFSSYALRGLKECGHFLRVSVPPWFNPRLPGSLPRPEQLPPVTLNTKLPFLGEGEEVVDLRAVGIVAREAGHLSLRARIGYAGSHRMRECSVALMASCARLQAVLGGKPGLI